MNMEPLNLGDMCIITGTDNPRGGKYVGLEVVIESFHKAGSVLHVQSTDCLQAVKEDTYGCRTQAGELIGAPRRYLLKIKPRPLSTERKANAKTPDKNRV